MSLKHLFDAELKHQGALEPIVSAEGREGELVGNGDGTITGPEVEGTLRWTLYEGVGETVCTMHPAFKIQTNDGATIRFDGKGFAVRATKDLKEWRTGMSLRFETDDERYGWLDGALGFWEGTFDSGTGQAQSRVYVREDAQRGVA